MALCMKPVREKAMAHITDLSTATATAISAATVAGAMYLDAKFHISRDLRGLELQWRVLNSYKKAVKSNRQSLFYLFETQMQKHHSEECIWSRDASYTWDEAYEQICRYAQFFLAKGVQPGQLVAFYLQNCPELMFCWFGLLAIGAAPALLNYNLSGDALIHCLKVPATKLFVVDEDEKVRCRVEDSRDRVEGELDIQILVLDEHLRQQIAEMDSKRPSDEYRDRLKGSDPICLMYTSGTTGMPKGIGFPVSRGYSVATSAGTQVSLPSQPKARWYQCMPLYHGTGGIVGVQCMTAGFTLCIGRKFSASQFWEDIRTSKATGFVYVGETARYLLARPPSPRDKEHNVKIMYGNGLRPDVWLRFQERFGIPEVGEFFSSTEGVFGLLNHCTGPFTATAVGHHGLLTRFRLRNIYAPVLFSDSSSELPRDPATGFAIRVPFSEGGEILVRVPSEAAFTGYWRNQSATSSRFVRDVFEKGDLYYRTGDALRRDNDGRWYFLDRLGDSYRWKSENVSTTEVAAVLGRISGILQANVYGVLVPKHDGRAGCAALLLDERVRDTFDFGNLLNTVRNELPPYAVPVFLRIVTQMPLMDNNKENKKPLKEEGINPAKVSSGDRIMWLQKDNKKYVDFTLNDWESLVSAKTKL